MLPAVKGFRPMHSGGASLKLVSGRAIGVMIAALLAAAATLAGIEQLRQQSEGRVTCPQGAGSEVCRFEGTPLRVSGTPVYIGNRQGAFLPTLEEISFVDGSGRRWIVPPDTLTDGASIPTLFAPLVGDRQRREYLLAAALHDAYCGIGNEALSTYQSRPWEEVHRMFYDALLTAGTPPRIAKVMFAAVYLGGPRWNDPARALDMMSDDDLMKEMKQGMDWIERADPGPEEIMDWMKDREAKMRAAYAE